MPPSSSSRLAVVLVSPETPENVGLAARGMANTGVSDLRLVGLEAPLPAEAYKTAVHAEGILDAARFFPTLSEAVTDRRLVLASTARARRNMPLLPLEAAVGRIAEYPETTPVGLVFGGERTGLSGPDLTLSHFRFHIPQAARQPSYNLGVAVTLTLFALAAGRRVPRTPARESPLTHAEQEEAIRRFRALLDSRGFMHDTNRAFIEERVGDIFRRMVLTEKDRNIILALFRTAIGARTGRKDKTEGRPPCPTR